MPTCQKHQIRISSFIVCSILFNSGVTLCSPKGLCAVSAKAVTVRRCPHSGVVEDFLARQPVFVTKMTVTQKPKVEKSIPRCEMGRLSKGYKGAFDKIWVPVEKKRSLGPKSEFLGPKRSPFLDSNHILATTGKSCANKKVPFSEINISLLADFGCLFKKKKRIFGQKDTFWPNIKMVVSPLFRLGPVQWFSDMCVPELFWAHIDLAGLFGALLVG